MMNKENPQEQNGENKIYGKVQIEHGQEVYDSKYNRFADVVNFMGEYYDAHGGMTPDGDYCWYRCMSEDYFQTEYPTHIKLDKYGNVVEALEGTGRKKWSPREN